MIRKMQSRRTVLGSVASAAFAVFSGCLNGTRSNTDETEQSTPFEQITVEGVHLVVKLSTETSIDRLSIVEPTGELFAERSISPGVTRETVRLGTDYDPGEYEVRGLKEDETVGTSTINIQPELEIVDVKLARNHPDEMYEGAGRLAIGSEVIVSIRNQGNGPASLVALRFEGNIPNPLPEDYRGSGIYDMESDVGGEVEEFVLPAHNEVVLFSTSGPFSPTGDNVSCVPNTFEGTFRVLVRVRNSDSVAETYSVMYTGNNLFDCEISKSRV